MTIDVTDATFEAEVLARSEQTPVVVDLWAPWCGPCRTLGPILEKVIDETEGRVVLAKVDTDQNPLTAKQFSVQSIPAVYGLRERKVIDHFLGARAEREVRAFVDALLPSEVELEVARLVAIGDEASLRTALELAPDHVAAVCALARCCIDTDRGPEALDLLERIPETPETRRLAAMARHGDAAAEDVDATLESLLGKVRTDDAARERFVDLLELLGPDDPRTAQWRKRLTASLY